MTKFTRMYMYLNVACLHRLISHTAKQDLDSRGPQHGTWADFKLVRHNVILTLNYIHVVWQSLLQRNDSGEAGGTHCAKPQRNQRNGLVVARSHAEAAGSCPVEKRASVPAASVCGVGERAQQLVLAK